MDKNQYYQVKVTIQEIEPPIWRRLLIPSGITFHKLHKITQASFQWLDYHLFLFEFPDFLVKEPDPDYPFHEKEIHPKK